VIAHLGGFLAVSAVVIVTPGPDTVLTVRNALAGGRRAGMCTGAGVSAGQVIWALLTAAGMAVLLAASRPAFDAIRIAGAVYLIFLGLRSAFAAARRRPAGNPPEGRRPGRLQPGTAFGQGVLSNLGNPKMAVFFASLLPQFAGPGGAPPAATLAFGLAFSAMTFAWLAGYAAAAARAGHLLRKPRSQQVLSGICGVALTGLGIWLATEAG
jgi:threonine/homoserine/homoserine lactone efflux protein